MDEAADNLFRFLAELGIETTTATHPPLYTVEQSQALRGQIAGAHTKNLFLRDRKDAHFLVTVEEQAEIDLKRIHTLIGASGRVSFGKPERLMEYLGVVPGAVTAFGLLNDKAGNVRFVLDASLAQADIVNAHPLTNEATTSIAGADLLRFVKATGHEPLILNISP
ncbi:MAG: prolyl-tRNA synthetase associated domain-containing protein [Rhizobiaceae bacterium]